jgi:hypothetical protein
MPRVVLGVVIAYALLLHDVWNPRYNAPLADGSLDFDDSWLAVMHHAWIQSWQHGKDIIWTGGPYSFAWSRMYHPETYLVVVVLQLFFVVLLVLLLWRLLRLARLKAVPSALIVWIGFELCQATSDAQGFAVITMTLLLSSLRPEPRDIADEVLGHTSVVGLCLLSLMKHSFLIACVPVVMIIAAQSMIRRRRFPWEIVTYSCGLLIFWSLAGQRMTGIPSYLATVFEISRGYTEAMHRGTGGHVELLLYLASAAIAWAWLAVRLRHVRGGLVLGGTGVGFLLWFLLKAGFVREGGRDYNSMIVVLVVLAVGVVFAKRIGSATGRGSSRTTITLLLASIAFAGFTALYLNPVAYRGLAHRVLEIPPRVTRPVGAMLHPVRMREQFERGLAGIRRAFPLPPLSGTVDLYPHLQTVLLAHDLDYRPRPIIQSYSAYTPELAMTNRRHLERADAPDHIVWTARPVDGRCPSLEDGPSWPTLLTRYRVASELRPGWLLLVKERIPRDYSLTPIGEVAGTFEREIEVPSLPDGSAVWAEIDVRPTLAGRLLDTLYKPPVLILEATVSSEIDGPQVFHSRFVPGMGRAGFVLSPMLRSAGEFAFFLRSDADSFWADNRVRTARLRVGDGWGSGWAYDSRVRLRFYRLSYPKQLPADDGYAPPGSRP